MFNLTTHNATSNCNFSYICESEILHRLLKSKTSTKTIRIGRETTTISKLMTLLFNLNKMISNRHTDFEFTFGIRSNHFTIARTDVSINIERTTFDRHSSIFVINYTLYLKRRYILKIDIIKYNRRRRCKNRFFVRTEFVHAKKWYNIILNTFRSIRNSVNQIVTISISNSFV